MTMHEALHPKDNIDRLYESRKEGGRGLASMEDSVDTSIRRPEDYIKGASTNNKGSTEQLYGYFKRQPDEISQEKTWTRLRKGNLKRETESLLITK